MCYICRTNALNILFMLVMKGFLFFTFIKMLIHVVMDIIEICLKIK